MRVQNWAYNVYQIFRMIPIARLSVHKVSLSVYNNEDIFLRNKNESG